MYKNRFILILGLLSMLLVGMAVTQSRSLVSSATGQAANDFYQQHPELNIPVERSIDTTDYFFRHLDKNASPLVVPFSAEQMRREYILGERYGVTPQDYAHEQALHEYWLGERYGQIPIALSAGVVNECFYVPVSEIACRNQSQAPNS